MTRASRQPMVVRCAITALQAAVDRLKDLSTYYSDAFEAEFHRELQSSTEGMRSFSTALEEADFSKIDKQRRKQP